MMTASWFQRVGAGLMLVVWTIPLLAQSQFQVKATARILHEQVRLRTYADYLNGRPGKIRHQTSVYVQGQTNLPTGTVLEIFLNFEGRRIEQSWRRVWVDRGLFRQRIVVQGNILSGPYLLTIRYAPARQAPSILKKLENLEKTCWKFPIYLGTPAQERQQCRALKQSLHQAIQECSHLFQQLQERMAQYHKVLPPDGITSIRQWIQEWQKAYQHCQTQLQQMGPPAIWAPRRFKTLKTLQSVMFMLQVVFRHALHELGQSHPDLWNSKIRRVKSRLSPHDLQRYNTTIQNRLQQLRLQSVAPQMSVADLELDLKRLNTLYQRLHKIYQLEQSRGYNRERWQVNLSTWRDDWAYFKEQMGLYRNCELARQYPTLIPQLFEVLVKLQAIAQIYDQQQQQHRAPQQNVQKLISQTRGLITNLYQIIAREKAKEQKRQLKIRQRLASFYQKLLKLERDLNQTYRAWQKQSSGLPTWQNWHAQWHSRLIALQEELTRSAGKHRERSSGSKMLRLLRAGVGYLKLLDGTYSSDIQGHRRQLHAQRVEYYQSMWRRVHDQLQPLLGDVPAAKTPAPQTPAHDG